MASRCAPIFKSKLNFIYSLIELLKTNFQSIFALAFKSDKFNTHWRQQILLYQRSQLFLILRK